MYETVKRRTFNEEYWGKGTNHESNNLKLQKNKKTKTSNTKEQPLNEGRVNGCEWEIKCVLRFVYQPSCCEPTEFIWAFLFHNYSIFTPPPPYLNPRIPRSREMLVVSLTRNMSTRPRWRHKVQPGGVKLENLWNKKAQMNFVGWQHTRIDNNRTNKALYVNGYQAEEISNFVFCLLKSH